VTVVQGTDVTWRNLDSIPHVVTITTSVSSDEVVDQATVDAGGEFRRPFDTPGSFGYRTDAIPSMRGTVEVQGPDGATGHSG
jgi:plastocyanin